MSQSEDIGAWEKHTKGIGMKLLQKFGFKGRLGANEDGISAAISVVVRPTNVGLGFGDTVEAPNLPENKKIEAEWKGVEYVEPVSTSSRSEDLSGWKKTNFNKKKRKATFNEESILDAFGDTDVKVPQMIIDMRSEEGKLINSSDGVGSSSSFREHILGQELLHNVGLVAQMQSAAVTAESRQIANIIRKKDSLQKQLIQMQAKQALDASRIATLNEIKSRLVLAQCNSFDTVCSLIQSLHAQYPQEFVLFGLLDLIPGFLSSAFKARSWSIHDNVYFIDLMTSMLSLLAYFEEWERRDAQTLQSTSLTLSAIYSRCTELEFLPSVRRFITNELTLDCSHNFILLLSNLKFIISAELFDQLVDSALLPKLVSLTEQTTAATINGVSILSLLPLWIPLLKTKLRAIFPAVKKLIVKSVNNWQPLLSHNHDQQLFTDIVAWKDTLDANVLDKVLVDSVVPKLLIVLRSQWTDISPRNDVFQMVAKWFDLLPPICLECLLQCEFCPVWLHSLYEMLSRATTSLDVVSEWYMEWKQFIALRSHIQCLCITAMCCVGMNMIRSTLASWDNIEEPSGVHQYRYLLQAYQSLHFDEMLQLRLTEQLLLKKIEGYEDQKEGIKHGIASALGGSASSGSSIKDVIESIALERGIVFVPKQGKALVHGRPVWLFGRSQIYFDQRVVFMYKESAAAAANAGSAGIVSPWVPVALDELLNEQ